MMCSYFSEALAVLAPGGSLHAQLCSSSQNDHRCHRSNHLIGKMTTIKSFTLFAQPPAAWEEAWKTVARLLQSGGIKQSRPWQHGHRDGGIGVVSSRALMARRNSGSVGLGGGGFSGRFFPRAAVLRRRCWRLAHAMQVMSAYRCKPVQDRPSKWSRPSSCLSCWCACLQTQRALMVAAKRRNAVRGGRLLSDEPDVFTGQVAMARAARSIGHAHASGWEARGEHLVVSSSFLALPADAHCA